MIKLPSELALLGNAIRYEVALKLDNDDEASDPFEYDFEVLYVRSNCQLDKVTSDMIIYNDSIWLSKRFSEELHEQLQQENFLETIYRLLVNQPFDRKEFTPNSKVNLMVMEKESYLFKEIERETTIEFLQSNFVVWFDDFVKESFLLNGGIFWKNCFFCDHIATRNEIDMFLKNNHKYKLVMRFEIEMYYKGAPKCNLPRDMIDLKTRTFNDFQKGYFESEEGLQLYYTNYMICC